MLEIYNEKIQDLLIYPKNRPQGGFRIRESKSGEIYVDGISKLPANSFNDIESHIAFGTTNRTIGSTNMNATSS